MSNTRTISGIPDELWNKALNNYDNVSAKIKELLKKDLENTDDKEQLNLLKKADLNKNQEQVARKLLEKGVTRKNEAQWNTFVEAQGINRTDYKKKCRNSITESKYLPYIADGRGIKAINLECPCGDDISVPELADTGGECLWCERQLYNFENLDEKEVLKIKA